MARSKLQFKRSTIEKLTVNGILSEDGTYITYTDENDSEIDVKISDLLNVFKNQPIEFGVQLKGSEELNIIPEDSAE